MKKKNKAVKVIGIVILVIVAVMLIGVGYIAITTGSAMKHQINAAVDMEKVKDGTYIGSSDGGIVQAKVSVTVENHKIVKIDLLQHRNGKGKPAEATLDEMIAKNTDDVDAVSGATASSKTIRNAVNVALQQGLEE